MWILDFDCCRPIQMDEVGVEQACAGFLKNDPFYPRPGMGEEADEELWIVFKKAFLEVSCRILDEVSPDKWFLADKLIEKLEEEGQARRRDREAGAS
jgi:hypothetical protein